MPIDHLKELEYAIDRLMVSVDDYELDSAYNDTRYHLEKLKEEIDRK